MIDINLESEKERIKIEKIVFKDYILWQNGKSFSKKKKLE